jgi:hypothetical protein
MTWYNIIIKPRAAATTTTATKRKTTFPGPHL